MKNTTVSKIEFGKWFRLTKILTLIIVVSIFGIEFADNIILYATRSQGYGPDTVVAKFLRYLVLTSSINFALYFLSNGLARDKRIPDQKRSYIQLIALDLVVGNAAVSHYQFACVFCIFALPIILSILYEDLKLNNWVTGIGAVLQITAIICRFRDPVYGKDMIPEGIIAVCFTIFLWVMSHMCINHLIDMRQRLNDALIAEEEQKHAEELQKKNDELTHLSQAVIEALAKAVDFNEPYTAGHSHRVAAYAKEIAKRLGYSEDDCQTIFYAGLLHDVGKIGIDNSIINKQGKLTEEEYTEIKKHPQMGFEILKDVSFEYASAAKYHHERLDGSGYPDHCREIPMIGRIIAVADSYDAMTSRRSYREIMPQEKVREEIMLGKGSQFDPVIADIMISMIDEDKDYNMKQK